jgi:hypothetical protein
VEATNHVLVDDFCTVEKVNVFAKWGTRAVLLSDLTRLDTRTRTDPKSDLSVLSANCPPQ